MADQYYLDPITGQYKVKPKANIVSQPTLTMGVGTSNPLMSALGLNKGQTLTMGQQTTDPITGKIITAPNTVYTPPPAVKSQTTTPPVSQTYIPPTTSKNTSQPTPQPTPQTTQTQPMGVFGFSMLMDAIRQKTQQNNELVKQRQLAIKQYFGGSLTSEEMNSLSPELQKALQSGDRSNIEMSIRILGDELSGQKTSLPQTLQYLTEGYKTELQSIEDKKKTMETALKDYATASQDPTLFKNYLETTYGDYLKGMGVDVNSLLGTGGGNINVYGIKSSPLTQSFGGVESGVMASDGGSFLASGGEQQDRQIAQQLLQSPIYANLTVDKALDLWSGNGYSPEQKAIEGVDPQAFIRDLPQDQIDRILDKIRQNEGITSVSSTDYLYGDFVKTLTPQGASYFNTLSDVDKSNVMQVVKGTAYIEDIAKGFGGGIYAKKLVSMATRVDPKFSPQENKIRVNYLKDWESGKTKDRIVAINTALNHLSHLKGAIDELNNTKLKAWNTASNLVKKQIDNPAVANFEYWARLYSTELAAIYKAGTGGASPTDEEIKAQENILLASYGPTTLNNLVNDGVNALSGRLSSQLYSFNSTMNRMPDDSIVDPEAITNLQNVGVDMTPINNILKKQGISTNTNNDPLNIR